MHVVVVGSGLAGLLTALRLARASTIQESGAAARASTIQEITLLTAGSLGAGASPSAQGGVSAAVSDDDSPELHAADTVAAGAGLVDADAALALCREAPAVIAELLELGVEFDRDATGDLAPGLEAAHSRARVLHAGGDATGARIVDALARVVRSSRVTVLEGVRAESIRTRNGAVSGLVTVDACGERRVLDAEAIVLATGGYSALYPRTTNPAGAIGSGVVLAHAAGAMVADLELVQFHPTVLAGGGLVSEAVRGEGATLLDASGRRFMTAVDARAELAPRDVVARAIARTMRAQGGDPVLLDARAVAARLGGAPALARRFPTIDALVRRSGIDWSRELVPVTPAAHYAMGGVLADLDGRTTVPGLFAVGETAATGVHGANRLASNSLLEAAVMARRLTSRMVAATASTIQEPLIPRGVAVEQAPPLSRRMPDATRIDAATLRARAWESLGLERDGTQLAALARDLADARPTDPIAETLLPLARLMAAAALARTESRGAHWRSDVPTAVESQRVRRVWAPADAAIPELWRAAHSTQPGVGAAETRTARTRTRGAA
ncbi:MAG: FAD-dependent oxidoreductase [Microcella sp.]|uniref:L-aspartate oxidase n=1 Tax=Microcella sp. TaxID=1913979 RepID=UPI002720B984|nr:FAD-dependent oxidoreductase [Microcella sp.]MDO8337355.1 FAD-dependent oxidoreductase [Microcella sp.]